MRHIFTVKKRVGSSWWILTKVDSHNSCDLPSVISKSTESLPSASFWEPPKNKKLTSKTTKIEIKKFSYINRFPNVISAIDCSEMYSEHCQTFKMELKTGNYFRKIFYLGCLTGFECTSAAPTNKYLLWKKTPLIFSMRTSISIYSIKVSRYCIC